VDTANGSLIVEAVRYAPAVLPLYSFTVRRRDACRIGAGGLWVEVQQSDIAVIAHVSVSRSCPAAPV
jgi:hypothetical protein